MSCRFPSGSLLGYRRQLAAECDKLTDPYQIRIRMQAVVAIQELGFMHLEISGCECWLEAPQNILVGGR